VTETKPNPNQIKMSMFSGLTNQISGWVANKTGQGEPGQEGVDPNMQQQPMGDGVNGEDMSRKVLKGKKDKLQEEFQGLPKDL